MPIVGVVERLQVPWVSAGGWGSTFNDNSFIVPFRIVVPYPVLYVVHAKPGQAAALIQAAPKKLFDISRARVIGKIRPMTALRTEIYKDDRGLAVISGSGLRGAVGGHRVRNRGSDQLLGGATPASDRNPPRPRRDAQCHHSIFPDREFPDCRRGRRGRGCLGGVAQSLDGERLCHAALQRRLCADRRGRGDVAGAGRRAVAGVQSRIHSAGTGDARRLKPARA